MKTMRTTWILLIAFLISSVAMATGNLRVNVMPAGPDNAVVNITNTKESNFEIKVRDDNGEVIFSKKTKEEAMDYFKRYDFSRLDDGTYELSVETETDTYKSVFSINRGNVELLDETRMVKPYFNFENDIFKMSYLNFDQNKLKIYVYGGDDLLIEKKLENDFAVHEGLDFTKSSRGLYKIVIIDDLEMFEYYVSVD